MTLSLKKEDLLGYLLAHLKSFIPDTDDCIQYELNKILTSSLDRLEYCFSKVDLPAFKDANHGAFFNHLHTDQYCMFLYFLSNEAYQSGYSNLYTRISVLNRLLNGIDLFGHVIMPDIFLLVHPIGTVIGRASFKNYLCIYQGVTIGGVHTDKGIDYPSFGQNVNIFAHSKIIGNCVIGKNVSFGANTFIINKNVESNSTITGIYPNCNIRRINTIWSPFRKG